MTVSEDAAIDDGWLDVYCLRPGSFWRLLPLFPALRLGRLRRSETALRHARAVVEVSTRRPMPVNTDGELTTTPRREFRVVPRALEVFVPASYQPSGGEDGHAAANELQTALQDVVWPASRSPMAMTAAADILADSPLAGRCASWRTSGARRPRGLAMPSASSTTCRRPGRRPRDRARARDPGQGGARARPAPHRAAGAQAAEAHLQASRAGARPHRPAGGRPRAAATALDQQPGGPRPPGRGGAALSLGQAESNGPARFRGAASLRPRSRDDLGRRQDAAIRSTTSPAWTTRVARSSAAVAS